MISLKSYLSRESDRELATAYRRIIGLFLQGIALHAVEGDKADHERFRADIANLEQNLTPDKPISEVFVLAGAAVKALEDYNRRTGKFVRMQSAELQNMVTMLTQTVISIGNSSEKSVTKLQDIEKQIERTRVIEDIQLLKLRLGECLEAVRDETMRQQADGRDALQTLKQQLETSQERVGAIPIAVDRDKATGLPGKADAEKAIREAAVSSNSTLLVLVVVGRVQAINARFGYTVGDEVLKAFANHLQTGLRPGDRLYRWFGPALVALVERKESLEQVRTEIQRVADAKIEKTVEIDMRTVLLPISASWSVFAITQPVETLLKKVETFRAAQIPRDYC